MPFLKGLIIVLAEDLIFSSSYLGELSTYFRENKLNMYFILREVHLRQSTNHNFWLNKYNEIVFFQLFRMNTITFNALLKATMERDTSRIIRKVYRGGSYPVQPEKALLVFLRYLASQETLHSLGDRFNLVQSTIMKIVNGFLYLIVSMKKIYIRWPNTPAEFHFIINGFQNYPGTVGAVDGSHINVKVPVNQQDSYINRHQNHSINLMGICTHDRIFTYVFIGYPGSAHDSRVLSNSLLVKNMERLGRQIYFPREDYHLIGDSAFPLRTWLMTPYSRNNNMTRVQRHHNKKLSADRVRIENTFGILKQRWSRLKFINTYCISKSIEIATAGCILHNFCYLLKDVWPEDVQNNGDQNDIFEPYGEAYVLGQVKRDEIAESLWRDRYNFNE